jgi:hypothetical protein
MKSKAGSDRVTYRELRNTPGRVWERLAADEPLTLMAEGEAKAILIPVRDGDVRAAEEAYVRGRALMAAAKLRRAARNEAGSMTLDAINAVIRKVRASRRRK